MKTNLLFFTKGKKTEQIWYYDLSHVKVGKKTPLTLAHFGFDKDGKALADSALPANLTADWLEQEGNAGKPFPSYARLLPGRGTAEAVSRYSWTVDFAERRKKAREEMEPILKRVAETKAEVVDLKEEIKRLKKAKGSAAQVAALVADISEKEKAARELEAQASAIDAAVFDLKAVNPSTVAKFDDRSPAEIIQSIHEQGRAVADALARLSVLVCNDEVNDSNEHVSLASEEIRDINYEPAV